MSWDSCREKVVRAGDKMCEQGECEKLQKAIDRACHDRSWPPATPVAIYNQDGTLCYCCCTGTAHVGPVEESPGRFKAVQDFIPGDEVRACGLDLVWRAAKVDWSSGVSLLDGKTTMIEVRFRMDECDRSLIVADDHLFLTYDRMFAPAGALHRGDTLMGADGQPVGVIDAHPAMNHGCGTHNISTGPFTGDVEGHLINASGIVIADQAVKVASFTGALAAHLKAGERPASPSAR